MRLAQRLVCTLGLGLAIAGCEAETSTFVPRPDLGGQGGQGGVGGQGGEGGAGAQGGEGGAGAQGGEGGAGAQGGAGGEGGVGAQGGEGGEGGAGAQGGMGGEGGEGGGMGGDGGMGGGGPVPMGPAPEYEQVATATVGERTYVAWSIDGSVWLRTIDFDNTFTGPAEEILQIEASSISALTVDGIPWFVYTTADGAQVAFKGDEPEAPALELTTTGRPLLAQLGNRLMVVGDTEGGPGWHLLTGEPGEIVTDPILSPGLPRPGSAGQVSGGVVLHYPGPGQCVFVDDGDGDPIGNFPCQNGAGRLLSDGARAIISYETLGENNSELIEAVPTFGFAAPFLIGGLLDRDWLRFQSDNGVRSMVVQNRGMNVDRQLKAELNLASPSVLRQSVEAWATWPYPTARAVVARDDEALVLVFGTEDDPRIETVELQTRTEGNNAYGFDYDESCTPEAETCDGEDEDCNGVADNGLCCELESAYQSRGFSFVDLHELDEGTRPRQWLFSDSRSNGSFRMMLRVAEDRWVGIYEPLWRTQADNRSNDGELRDMRRIANSDIEGAYEGFGFHSIGGHDALIARNADGDWTVFWMYSNRDTLKEPTPLPCETPLASDSLAHSVPDGSPRDPMVVVCTDKVVIMYPNVGDADHIIDLAPFEVNNVDWATIARTGDGVRTVMLGHLTSLGQRRITALSLIALNRSLRPVDLPDDVRDAVDTDAPVYRSPIFGRPYVQIRPVDGASPAATRALVRRGSDWEWVNLISAPFPTQAGFAQRRGRLTVSGSIDGGTGFWVFDIADHDELNAWSTEPAFVIEEEPVFWAVSSEANPDNRYYRDDLMYITGPAEGERLYTFHTRRVQCQIR